MGKGKKPQNEDEVLGQIFDFIFKEARKPVDKRRPVKLKPTGISTSHEIVDGLAATLEQPGMFVTDQILTSMNKALTVEFGRLKANEDGSAAATFTTASLASFLSDPNKFLSKPKDSTKMGIRDVMKAAFLGRVQQGLVANAWAQKYNLDLDAKKAIRGHYQAESIGREAEAGRALAFASAANISGGGDDSRKNYLASRSADLVGREIFGRDGWEAMSDEKKIGLQKAITRGKSKDGKKDLVHEYLNTTYTGTSAKLVPTLIKRYDDLRVDMELLDPADPNKDKSFDLFDLKIYNKLEVKNIEGRRKDMELYLLRHPGLSINEQVRIQEGIQQLGQAAVIVSGSLPDLDGVEKARKELNQRISDCKDELVLAKKAGDKDKIQYYKYQIKNLKSGDKTLKSMNFWGTIGKYEGMAGSLKDVLGAGLAPNAISSILDGSLYDKNRNSFHLPCEQKGVVFASHTWKLKDEEGIEYDQPYKEEIKINIPVHRELKGLKGSKKAWAASMNQLDAVLTNIYYLTPQSIMKSLFVNGEAFVYLSYKTTQNALKKLGAGGAIDFKRLMKDGAYRKSLKKMGVDANSLWATRGLAQIFSFGQRKRDMAKAWLDEHVYRIMRQRIYNSLVKRIANEEALVLLEKWLAKGGFEVVAKALVIAILDGIGIAATGGLGSFLVPILSSIVVDVLYAGAKVIIQVLLLVLAGVIGLVWYGSSSAKQAFDAQTYAYTNVVPGDVKGNPNYQDIPDINYPGEPGNPHVIYTGDIEAIFNQVRDEMGLHTTLELVTCTDGPDPNEGACSQIDWAWCYSGSSVFCRIDKLEHASDLVLTNLFRHELMHQIQSGGDTLVREWGADFVSSNGGGYRFSTPDGVKRATETRSALLARGCTEQLLNDIAFGRGLGGPCYDTWRAYIQGFAAR